ncbi:MAG: aminopeptidase [Myxococcales bacterium]|nr:aminopeptidase [Myxococcales bacterium]
MSRAARAAAATLALTALAACEMPAYLGQAVHGQLDLLRRARPIDDVIDDPEVPVEIRLRLAEIAGIKAFGADAGLNTRKNYRTYVDVPEGAAVWFVGASKPLAFQSPRWCFPIAGCFTGLGWFDRDDAIAHRERLKQAGWDAMARPAGAYSTGGWFPDPVVSSMLDADVAPYAELANVLLHESVHATVFIPDQPYFNEGLAEAIGDALTVEWLGARFGPGSDEERLWLEVQDWRRTRVARQLVTFKALEALYASDRPRAAKLAEKARLLEALRVDLGMWRTLNNANLIELRVYQASYAKFGDVVAACGGARPMIKAARAVGGGDFTKPLDDDLAPALAKIRARCAATAK